MYKNKFPRKLFLVVVVALSACSGGDNSDAIGPPLLPIHSDRTFIKEHEFTDNVQLVAKPDQTVLLDLAASSNSAHITRHEFKEGSYQFCMEPDESFLSDMNLVDDAGNQLIHLTRDSGCVRVNLTGGIYQLHTKHDVSALRGSNRIAFVRASAPNPPLVTNGKPAGGWWALRPDDTTGKNRLGRVRMTAVLFVDYYLMPDFTSTQFDGASLFSFTDPKHPFVYRDAKGAVAIGYEVVGAGKQPLELYPKPSDFLTSAFSTINITDLGSYRMQFGKSNPVSTTDFYLFPAFGPEVVPVYASAVPGVQPASPPAKVSVLFRFYDDGTKIGPLNEGEIAVFQQCNFTGKAAVFVSDIPDLSAVSSAITTLSRTAASVRLGNNTAALLYSGNNYAGTPQIIKNDVACLTGQPATESISVRPLVSVITLSSKSCKDCRLVGADLSHLDLTGLDLTGSDLTEAKFNHSTLTKAVLTNGLLKEADFGNAIADGTIFDHANLEQSNFTNAVLTNNASLQGAWLKNANLAQANLNGADFSNASFYGSTAAADNSGVCRTDTSTCPTIKTGFTCSCASATGATMDGTKFNNAYLYGADFSGSSPLTNVDFSNAILISSSFNGRTITSDNDSGGTSSLNAAYLQGALLNSVTFGRSTLTNAFVDFTKGGNDLSLVLSQAHTQFRNSLFPAEICVNPFYSGPTTVPAKTPSTLICPDGSSYSDGLGCGSPLNPDGSGNVRWKSPIDIGRWTTPGWYDTPPQPTFPPPTPPHPTCNGIAVATNW